MSTVLKNLSGSEQKKRAVVGAVASVVGILAAVYLVSSDAPRWTRFLLFAPFFAGALGFLQAAAST